MQALSDSTDERATLASCFNSNADSPSLTGPKEGQAPSDVETPVSTKMLTSDAASLVGCTLRDGPRETPPSNNEATGVPEATSLAGCALGDEPREAPPSDIEEAGNGCGGGEGGNCC